MGEYDWLFYKFEKEDTNGNEMLPPYQTYFRDRKSTRLNSSH